MLLENCGRTSVQGTWHLCPHRSVSKSRMNHTWTYNVSFGAPTDTVEPRAGLSRYGHTVVAVFLGFIFFFGFMNNLIVLILFCKFKTLRNPVNMLLLNISISDMLVCISGTTLSFASNIHGKWIGGKHGCRWYGFVNSCFGIVSLISLAVLSYERYSTLTLCNKRSADYRKALLAVGGSWIYSLVWTVPPLIGWSSYGIEGAGTSCSVRWSSESAESTSYIICLFIFCLVIPVMVMMYCYGRLLYAVKQFYKCFRQLFHCQPSSSTDGEPTCHSKVSVIQLNQRTDGGNMCDDKPRPETDNKMTSTLHPEPSLEPVLKAVPPTS
ncbi:opsin-3-like isoform X2 [Athene cunicularia]|uniref:opsin-3-like isoform X2 n=1 Tax=Athene cunicularia TaxID=194338 RepID=UPI000EF6DEDA|nr:opsin-3-like isoform X2 [Athene cunicularia]